MLDPLVSCSHFQMQTLVQKEKNQFCEPLYGLTPREERLKEWKLRQPNICCVCLRQVAPDATDMNIITISPESSQLELYKLDERQLNTLSERCLDLIQSPQFKLLDESKGRNQTQVTLESCQLSDDSALFGLQNSLASIQYISPPSSSSLDNNEPDYNLIGKNPCLQSACTIALESTKLLVCSNPTCDVVVHPACYGVVLSELTIDSDTFGAKSARNWLCDRCDSILCERVKCQVCPRYSGAFIRLCDSSQTWIHVVCYWMSIWLNNSMPASHFVPKLSLPSRPLRVPIRHNVYGRNNEASTRMTSCYFCERASEALFGTVLKCDHPGCEKYFHATCAHRFGFFVDHGLKAHCLYHHPSRPALCELNPWSAWSESSPKEYYRQKYTSMPSSGISPFVISKQEKLPLMYYDFSKGSFELSNQSSSSKIESQVKDELRTDFINSGLSAIGYICNTSATANGSVLNAKEPQNVSNGTISAVQPADYRSLPKSTYGISQKPSKIGFNILGSANMFMPKTQYAPTHYHEEYFSQPNSNCTISSPMRHHNSQSPEDNSRSRLSSHLKIEGDALYLERPRSERTFMSVESKKHNHGFCGPRFMPYNNHHLSTNASDDTKSLLMHASRTRVFSAGPLTGRDQGLQYSQQQPSRIKIQSDMAFTTQNVEDRQQSRSTPLSTNEFYPIFQGDLGCEYDKISAQHALYEPTGYPHLVNQFPRFPGDLYIPFWTRGVGKAKEGLCRLCPPESWLKIKISAYWYHMNFHHGINQSTGRPYRSPVCERYNSSAKIREGLCHECRCWIALDSVRHTTVNVPQIYWWKHAQKCHQ